MFTLLTNGKLYNHPQQNADKTYKKKKTKRQSQIGGHFCFRFPCSIFRFFHGYFELHHLLENRPLEWSFEAVVPGDAALVPNMSARNTGGRRVAYFYSSKKWSDLFDNGCC